MYRGTLPILLMVGLLAAACGAGAVPPTASPSPTPGPLASPTVTPQTGVGLRQAQPEGLKPAPTGQRPAPISEEQLRQELKKARFSTHEWGSTNFRIRSVPLREFFGGGPGKDDIPPIDAPKFETVEQANKWLSDREAVQVVEIKGDARAYPQQIMIWHEIVNDTVGGEPVTITY